MVKKENCSCENHDTSIPTLSSKTVKHNVSRPKFTASSKYAKVNYTVNNNNTIRVKVKFNKLKGVSAIHIHTNDNGSPGPIIAWLVTSKEWQLGVTQNTPGENLPCCSSTNKMCALIAPDETPYTENVQNTTVTFDFKKDFCGNKCPWIDNGTFLVIHGYNFQKVIDGCLTNEKPGIDAIEAVPFTLVKDDK
jgi:hypothetical protein